MIENAKRAGQHALVEELARGLEHHRAEAQLVALGLTKYVREEDVISFYKECPKGLRLSWVGNFGRAIPETVVHSKIRADDVGAFDNYVVLHYDPGAKSFLETEKEKEARKDPILFGLMRGKRVLYFVGDWVDELCDLTLDQLAERVGQESIQSLVTPSPYR
ncbi:MAG: hypothetical protein BWY99_02663 [Synergistetes bacterium ADurb.BinA166]|nr:MAG: hypothetical protein BWY99_02663 [Synergistetes bacterium ADurb.BinA166]